MRARHSKRQRLISVPTIIDPSARPVAVDLPSEISILPVPTKSSTSLSTSVESTTSTSSRASTASTSSRTSTSSTSSTALTSTFDSESSSSSVSSPTTTTTSSAFPTGTTPTITPTPVSTYATTSNGVVRTVTTFLNPSSSATGKPANNLSSAPKGFLQNKAASGTVFGLLGLVALICIIVVATFAIRRRRKNRLVEEAISFDPSVVDAAAGHHYDEKPHGSLGTSRAPTPQLQNDYGYYGGGPGGMGPSMSAAPDVQHPYRPPAAQMGNNMQYPSRLAYAQYAPSGPYTRG